MATSIQKGIIEFKKFSCADNETITISKTVHFNPPYLNIPKVHVGYKKIDHCTDYEGGNNFRVDTNIINVTNDSFTVEVNSWDGTTLYEIHLNWISLP